MARSRSRSVWAVAALSWILVLMIVPRAQAALGLTDFAIDGDASGPNDWNALPATILESATTLDACGSGVLDPDQLDGKLADLDLDSPNPTPGNVAGKGDLCRVWRAAEAVSDGSGDYQLIMYGAWSRDASNGEVALYWPLVGPTPGKDDDFLVTFDATSSGQGTVGLLGWNGSEWVPGSPLPDDVFEAAVDEPGSPLFGEFALNLTAAGLWTGTSCTPYASDFVFTRTGNASSAELQDYAGLAPSELTRCADLVIKKETTPAAPDPAEDFEYLVIRSGGGDVLPAEPSVTGTLTVPGAAVTTLTGVSAAADYRLTEPSPPPGWSLEAIECEGVDPSTGETGTVDVTAGGTFPVAPGRTTRCTITDVGPATLTIVKATVPAAETRFDFTGTRQGGAITPFSLTDGTSHPVPVSPGDTVTVTETIPNGWDLAALDCTGDQEATSDTPGAAATVRVDAGEQIVCTFVNERADQTAAALIVAKTAPGSDTSFDFSVDGPSPSPGSFTLTPPDDPSQLVTVTPEAGGSTYTVTEEVPDGWRLDPADCADRQGSTGSAIANGVSVTMVPGQVVFCRFVDQPIPPSASLTIVKATDPAGGTGFTFDTPGLTPSRFSLDDTESHVFTELDPGTYPVSEQLTDNWVASGTCDNGAAIRGGRVDVLLEAGDDVVCTFHNERRVSLTVTKRADPASAQDFRFSVARNRVAPGTFTLDDDGDPSDDPDNGRLPRTLTGTKLLPGLYTITETLTTGWQLVTLQCTGGQVIEQSVSAGRATVRLDPGAAATCLYANRQTASPAPTSNPRPTATARPSPSESPTQSAGPAPAASTQTPLPETPAVTGRSGESGIAQTGAGRPITFAGVAGLVLVLAGAALLGSRRRRRHEDRAAAQSTNTS